VPDGHGKPVGVFEFPLDAAQVRRFAEAAWDDDPRYQPGDDAWTGALPPTFLGAAATLAGRQHSVPAMGFDVARAFHGSEIIRLHRDVRAGSVLHVEETFRPLSDVHGARGGRMHRTARASRFLDDDALLVATTERVIMETERRPPVPAAPQGLHVFDEGLYVRPDPIHSTPALFSGLDDGHAFPTALFGPVTRTDFVRYAVASGDVTAIHFDEEAARAAGYPAVFAMGMFSAALIGHALTAWVTCPPPWTLSLRFSDLLWPGESLSITGRVAASGQADPVVELRCISEDRLVTKARFEAGVAAL
jgi:acyl dehydratase